MSGFSSQWLALRESADHRARHPGLKDMAVRYFASRAEMRVTDLGCGTGSNLRALAPHLASVQHWRLVDHDADLLEAAAQQLTAWADRAEPLTGARLRLWHADRRIDVEFVEADLVSGIEAILAAGCDLVTAAAFFDLVSEEWIGRFVAASIDLRVPLYTVLTYDGRETWVPRHACDQQMLAAFHAHQARDKGFGPAAGPRAAGILAESYRARGWRVLTGESPWTLDMADRALMSALVNGAAGAVAETGLVASDEIERWRTCHHTAQQCEIGHLDLLALPDRQ